MYRQQSCVLKDGASERASPGSAGKMGPLSFDLGMAVGR